MNLRSIMVLLLSAVLLVMGAVLPMAVAGVQDSMNTEKVGYASINAVNLEFSESPMTIREKLAVAAHPGSTVDIPEELADHSQEEITDIALEKITPYQDEGLLLGEIDRENLLVTAIPVLLSSEDPQEERSCIVWYLVLSPAQSPGDCYWTLYLTLDDETGTLCSMEYSFHAKDQTRYQRTGSNADQLLKFCRLYIDGLGEEFAEYAPEDLLKEAWTSPTGDNIYTMVNWGDIYYGEVQITLYMTNYGFGTTYYYFD